MLTFLSSNVDFTALVIRPGRSDRIESLWACTARLGTGSSGHCEQPWSPTCRGAQSEASSAICS
jgi:hypothetical protein